MAVLSESDGITGGTVISIKWHRFSMTTLGMASAAAINRLLLQSLIWFIAIQHSICKQLWSLFGSNYKEQFTNLGFQFSGQLTAPIHVLWHVLVLHLSTYGTYWKREWNQFCTCSFHYNPFYCAGSFMVTCFVCVNAGTKDDL